MSSPVLIVTKDKKQVARTEITGATCSIGRSKECVLPVDEQLASRHHAEITREGSEYFVRDCDSRNGTKLNGEKLTARKPLKNGDEIGIGETKITFHMEEVAASSEGSDSEGATMFADMAQVEKSLGQQVAEKKDKGSVRVKVAVLDGPLKGGVFRDWDGALTIGRGLENNVVLLDDAVSSKHARIVCEGGEYLLEDLGSSNGTFINGVKVRREKLSNGQKVKVGVSTLSFEMVDLAKQRRTLKFAAIGAGALILILILVKVLQPADVAGQHIAKGDTLVQAGELSKALEEYQSALKIDPKRAEARKGLDFVRTELESRDTLKAAEVAAREENYDKAKELVYRVLRNSNSSRAREMEAIIKAIENAKIAYTARNWADAIKLLEKARVAYPKSNLIALRLADAEKELAAQQSLAKAEDALKHSQTDMAEGMLKAIPEASVYYTAAKEHLDNIERDRKVASWLVKAQAGYREGQVAAALTEIENGLQALPNSVSLIALRDRVRKVEGLSGGLANAEGLVETAAVDALLQGRQQCADVLAAEADPLNAFRKRAQAAHARLNQWLQVASQKFATEAASALQGNNRPEAVRLYLLSLKADPGNLSAKEAADKLRAAVSADCRALYQKGIVHEDLGQGDLAREAFKQVLAIGFPGEEYYERALKKLKTNGP